MRIDCDAIRREQASLLRSQGMGYGKIAATTGLTKGVVRNLCLYLPVVPPNEILDSEMKNGNACSFCGHPIKQHGGVGRPRRFCSDYCRRQYWRLHRTEQKRNPAIVYTKQCKLCGESFEIYGKNDRKYCCRDHYLKHFYGENYGNKGQKQEEILLCQLSDLTCISS